MNRVHLAAISLTAVAVAIAAAPALSQQGGTGKTIARYTMDAGTTSGMMAMGQGGGIGAAMSMMRGGGNNVAHELTLRLGSTQSAAAPAADHFMPAGAGLGASVPLVGQRSQSTPRQEGPPQMQGQMPQ